jgi:phosphate:Na+ symporter
MSYSVLDFLTLIGSLVLFLFGMKLMSESLQKVAGNNLRKILAAMTSNRVFGVLTGIITTIAVQSSSATTVMIVSFVNAGLLSLIEAIGVIMGANVGTTVTAWLISLVGFKVNISALSLPLIGLSFPLIFSKKGSRKAWGEVLMGFALLFIGLDLLKNSVPDINSNPAILEFLQSYTNYGFASYLIFLLIGTILTVVLQSSSASTALTLVMCYNGWIPFDMAAAMILGENVGTTITANLAAIVANTSAKRAAFAHLVFNLIGVTWILLVFSPVLRVIADMTEKIDGASPFVNAASIPIALSIFHTSFNVANVLLQVWFVKTIAKFVTRIIKKKGEDEEEFSLKYLYTGLLNTSELSIIQARKEIIEYGVLSQKMFEYAKRMYRETDEKKFKKLLDKMEKSEIKMDELEIEIANYLTQISEGDLSIIGSRKIRTLLKITDNIESLADTSYNISRVLNRKRKRKIWFTPEQREDIQNMFNLIDKSFKIVIVALNDLQHDTVNLDDILEIERQINEFRDYLRKQNAKNIADKKYSYQSSVVYVDLFTLCEVMGDHLINIAEALESQRDKLV